MARTLLAALAVLVATAVPATAAADSYYVGGCGYDTVTDPTWQVGEPDHYTGVLYATAVVYSESDPATPVSGTLTCHVYLRGEEFYTASFSGTGAIAGVGPVPFEFVSADPVWEVELCETFDFADDTPTSELCYTTVPIGFPPQPLIDAIDAVVGLVPGGREAICAFLRSGAVPNVGRTVQIDDGDLYVDRTRYWDC